MTAITCISVVGCEAGLALLERLAFAPADLPVALPRLLAATEVSQLAVLSTCQRVELYATAPQRPDPAQLVRALAAERGVPEPDLQPAVAVRIGRDAVHHLLRVAAGLRSFVLGEREIVGQVRAAAQASRAAGVSGPELDRLLGAAVRASRRVHAETSFAATGRSVAEAALDCVVARFGGALAGRRVLVVGAGDVATVVVSRAVSAGGEVTIANRTLRRAQRFADAGARVVDLDALDAELGWADVAVLATAAPHALVAAESLRVVRGQAARPLLLLDLSMPRNVDPAVRNLDGVELLDLDDLAQHSAEGALSVVRDVERADELVRREADRYLRWLTTRTAAEPVRRLRQDADAVAQDEARRLAGEVPPALRPVVEEALLRTAHRLVHGATRLVLDATEDGRDDLVALLSGVFAAGARVSAVPPQSARSPRP